MSSPVTKRVRRSTTTPSLRQSATKSSVKTRGATKAARQKPKEKSTAVKLHARKAPKPASAAKKKAVKPVAAKKKATAKPKVTAKTTVTAKSAKTTRKATRPSTAKAVGRNKTPSTRSRVNPSTRSRVKKTQKIPARAIRAQRPAAVTAPATRQPTVDEAAALRTFERAHKEFMRGRFAEARNQFRAMLDKYSQVSEVAARARTYLAIAETRLRTESILPRDADSLYDRGVIELNRGEYVAAQEMFERALKREPEAAHIHYGLAATRARLGSIDLALQSLERALDLQPNLRVRAQHDQDLTPLRNDPDFDRLVFTRV
jgi:tetratricopeptide (TPR) repeat protein